MTRCDGALDMLCLMFGVKPFGGQNSCKIEKKMKIKEYREKQVKYDPIAWSKCNICHQKYPNDEIVQHIHQKHLEKIAAHVHAGPVVSSSERRLL